MKVIEEPGTVATDLRSLIDQTNETNTNGPITKVTVQRYNVATGNYTTMGTVSVELCDESYVQRRWRKGTYKFRLLNQKGQHLTSISNIEIAEPDAEMLAEFDGEDNPPGRQLPAPAPAASEVEVLRAALERDHELMREMIRSFAQGAGQNQGGSLKDLVGAFVTLQQLQPQRPAGMDELFGKVFTQAIDIAQKINGRPAGDPQNEWLGFARDVFKEALPLLKQPAKTPAAAAQPNPPAAPGAAAPAEAEVIPEGEEGDMDLGPAIDFVKEQLGGGASPSFLVELTVNSMRGNQEFTDLITGAAEIPVEEIIAEDEDLQAEPMKTKFTEFFEALRARILATGNPGRPAGN